MPSQPKTVPAVWHGPFVGDRGPGVPPLQIGDVAEVTPDQLTSGHWTAVADVKDTPVEEPDKAPAKTKAAEVTS